MNEVDVNETMEDGTTAMHCAAEGNYVEIALDLIQQGAKVDSKNNKGQTPLHIAAERGHVEFMKLLLAKGGDINEKSLQGVSAMDLVQDDENVCKKLALKRN